MPKGVYDRSKVKKRGRDATTVPVKVDVKADPLNLQVTIDSESLEKACQSVQKRIDELAAHFQVPKNEVNPFEALFLIADLQKEMMMELKEIRKALTPPTVIKSSISTPVPWGTGDPSLREPR